MSMDSVTGASDHQLLQQALSVGSEHLPALVDRWTPVIQARVVRVLRRRFARGDGRATQEIEDLVQQVFVSLFEKGAAALRAWRPERGLSLDNWVGLLAEQQVLALLRTQKRNPWRDELALVEELDGSSEEPDPEHEALGRDLLDRLLDRMQERLSPLGWHLFCLLYLEERSVEAAARSSGLTTTAIYAWRSRLRKVARELRAALKSENSSGPHRPEQENPTRVTKA